MTNTPEANFSFFIRTIALQIAIAAGSLPNPQTEKIEKNPAQAKFLFDTLKILKEKTVNNLTNEEAQLINNLISEVEKQFKGEIEK